MNFLIKIPLQLSCNYNIRRSLSICQDAADNCGFFIESPDEQFGLFKFHEATYCIIGDFIIPRNNRHQAEKYMADFFSDFRIEKLRDAAGNFYLIKINEKKQQIDIANSMMGLLPVYYYADDNCICVSSRADLIVKCIRQDFHINRRYILEYFLFGYSFMDSTLFREIRLMPSNSMISITGSKIFVRQHTDITEYFTAEPKPWRRTLDDVSLLFIERTLNYLPDEPYYTSLTGGLDGRTVLAVGLGSGKNLTAYSYGSADDKDVSIPSEICKQINIPYKSFVLDKDYAERHFLDDAVTAGHLTEGQIRFSRATYLMMAREISSYSRYIMTGNFGSELLRASRLAGNVMSEIVYDLFGSVTDGALVLKIKNNARLKYLSSEYFGDEPDEIIEDCIRYRTEIKLSLTRNQKFHKFLFEEVFRKYFGPEIVLENNFVINRTPFLDFVFFRQILQTEFAGCNAPYKTVNPIARYKGQALYPHVIKQTYPCLLTQRLDRGYAPADFLKLSGRTKILYGYIMRKFFVDRGRYGQPGYNRLATGLNITRIDQIRRSFPFVNSVAADELFSNQGWEKDYIGFNLFVSFVEYLDFVLSTNSNVSLE